MLRLGASVNFYMFHGGTNFGFWNGANYQEKYEATITSYDYDSPLSECGDVTDKFRAVRSVVANYLGKSEAELPALPKPIAKKAFGQVKLTQKADLLNNLSHLTEAVQRTYPVPMEQLGQNYGYIVYSTTISGPRTGESLHIQEVHDRAQVFLDGVYQGVVERWDARPLQMDIPAGGAKLDIVVENMGRVNYGPKLRDSKGITEGVRMNNQFLFDWTIHPLPLDNLAAVLFEPTEEVNGIKNRPAFYQGEFTVDGAADTFVKLAGWTKGVVWINGFNLGRYWEQGPQVTLYVPGPLLQEGRNEIVILELHHAEKLVVELVDAPDLG
ncbi:Beta-galactosidase precursor [compost metagenome]